MPLRQAYPYPFFFSRITVAPQAFAILPVSSLEPLSTTTILLTFSGISEITFSIESASLKAGIITAIFISNKVYFFNSICCCGTIYSSKYHPDNDSKARKKDTPKVRSKKVNKVKFNFFLLGSIEH